MSSPVHTKLFLAIKNRNIDIITSQTVILFLLAYRLYCIYFGTVHKLRTRIQGLDDHLPPPYVRSQRAHLSSKKSLRTKVSDTPPPLRTRTEFMNGSFGTDRKFRTQQAWDVRCQEFSYATYCSGLNGQNPCVLLWWKMSKVGRVLRTELTNRPFRNYLN